MTAEESLGKAEELLERLERARAELERVTASDDADKAIDVLTELAEIAKQVEVELNRAKRAAELGEGG